MGGFRVTVKMRNLLDRYRPEEERGEDASTTTVCAGSSSWRFRAERATFGPSSFRAAPNRFWEPCPWKRWTGTSRQPRNGFCQTRGRPRSLCSHCARDARASAAANPASSAGSSAGHTPSFAWGPFSHNSQPSRCLGFSARLASSLPTIFLATVSNSTGCPTSVATLPNSTSSIAGPE